MNDYPGTPADEAMDAYANGDASAFSVVYEGVAPALYADARARCSSDALAERIVEQTFLSMHRARATFISGSAVLPWALAIARGLLAESGAAQGSESVTRLPFGLGFGRVRALWLGRPHTRAR